MLGGSGPRDWAPTAPEAPPPPPSAPVYSGRYVPARRTGSPTWAAWWSLLLGACAVFIAFFEPVNNPTARGFIVSTVGISAIVFGTFALRERRAGHAVNGAAARGGVLFGVLGTGIMAYTLAAFLLAPSGIYLPAIPWARSSTTPLTVGEQLPAPLVAQTPEVVPSPSTVGATGMTAQQIAMTGLSAGLQVWEHQGGLWPASLVVRTGDGMILLPSGQQIVAVPAGSTFTYQPSPDRTSFIATFTAANGAKVLLDSKDGYIRTE